LKGGDGPDQGVGLLRRTEALAGLHVGEQDHRFRSGKALHDLL